ncbi:hypothetical protein J4229_00430 [Candidatus Pacearchaeota archaeon]|nr:hypothetical protein [Candidatus Pacearchaeota archaeon]
MEEAGHLIEVIENVRKSIKSEDVLKLGELSNQTLHSLSTHQDTGNITMAVIVYTLSKLIERKNSLKIRNWNVFIKKIDLQFVLAIDALKEDNAEKYENSMEMARKTISSTSLNIRPYIQDIIRKASINKASKIYEHGISLGQTAKILGITEWELSEYAGQTKIPDIKYNLTLDVRKRAQMAMDFFS